MAIEIKLYVFRLGYINLSIKRRGIPMASLLRVDITYKKINKKRKVSLNEH